MANNNNMKILNSPVFFFLKDLEINGQKFYSKRIKGWFNDYKLKLKIKSLLKKKGCRELTSSQRNQIRLYYQEKNYKNISTLWHRFYSDSNGFFSSKYVPENLFYLKIEPYLNGDMYNKALTDKNLLNKLFVKIKQPETVVKNINGFFYNDKEVIEFEKAVELCEISENMIIKPTIETWGGNNIKLFNGIEALRKNENFFKDLFDSYEKNFIVQKKVRQHESMSVLNSSSLNTFRVMSILKKNGTKIISTIVRMGQEGSITDNSTGGGISCGINNEGELNEIGFQLTGRAFKKTSSGLKFKNIKVPLVSKVHEAVISLHQQIPYFRLVSWDLALDYKGDVVLIEYNVYGQDITFHQLNNGPVLAELIENENYQ